ncbi:iron-sulfur cluster biosynthesis family protein [Saccharibacillus sp. CPCC 101409]|uniref:iron-sulfur cluster biosynthesis family protein n=1 Tax=Saccharibacillus sp. CPCC 101409 TaxID=3058041 RepID=UPI0026725B52|nr:iron-sulfur cluster biosynthesis family protein [Saccharibacillus sp. CPCC 101409]MDO3411847.1 iron-sulfur cluster biosynthesis family protein [Saccharibacillus sp. CPCC 101409]
MPLTMKLSPEAQTLFEQKFAGRPGYIRLAYDNEGCGCSLSGAIALWLIDAPVATDEAVESAGGLRFIVDKNDAVYFDRNLSITISGFDKTSVRLASDGQSYGSSIRIEDRRAGAEVGA